jgi:hypothetical protein
VVTRICVPAVFFLCAHVAFGCELVVGDGSRYVEGEAGAAVDAATDSGPTDAAPVVDAAMHVDAVAPMDAAPHVDASAPVDAGCALACVATETTCVNACKATEATCNAHCANQFCVQQCGTTEYECALSCQNSCDSCAIPDNCGNPSPCTLH